MPVSLHRATAATLVLSAIPVVLPSPGFAQPTATPPPPPLRAPYATVTDLRPEGLSHLFNASLYLGYARVFDSSTPQKISNLSNLGTFSFRNRALLGRSVAYCVGLDGTLGGADNSPDGGFVYGLTGYLLGVGARWGLGNSLSLCSGAGLSGITNSVPFAGRFPVELRVSQSIGPVRFTAWASLAWTAGATERHNGSTTVSFTDETEAGLTLRLGRQRQYWSTTTAGGGPSIGVIYREFMGARQLAVVFGLDLTGAR